ncbi:putative quinol monooxygenase [Sorangium sp. So ce388]|uniref:putative quinol monooxygenase n=1 Tax=Sorangium sp. So ce388 TaxID=3133309 RepID=UPI003F5C206D
MLIINSTWTVVPGQEAAARQALAELAKQVHEGEPETWMYLIHVSNSDPGVNAFPPAGSGAVTFFEGFKDASSFLKHVSGPILQGFIAKHGALLLNMYGPTLPFVTSQALDTASGFIRPEADEPSLFTVIARWNIKQGAEDEALRALEGYVAEVHRVEPGTFMYTANIPSRSAQVSSFPPSSPNQLVFNSGWKDHDAFIEHTQAAPYRDFLARYGHLFLQVNGEDTGDRPYMTTAVLKRIAGFFRPEAFSTSAVPSASTTHPGSCA